MTVLPARQVLGIFGGICAAIAVVAVPVAAVLYGIEFIWR